MIVKLANVCKVDLVLRGGSGTMVRVWWNVTAGEGIGLEYTNYYEQDAEALIAALDRMAQKDSSNV